MDEEQRQRFEQAVERKKEAAEAASQAPPAHAPDAGGLDEVQRSRIDTAHTQDDFSVRDKNSGKGKKTADKWNQ
jgi:hypothetical protein